MNSAQLVSYDTFKSLLTSYGMEDGLPLHFVASAMAGTVATTICSPADVIKSRVMHSRDPLGPLHVITTSLKNEGPKFMFKGWLPSWSEYSKMGRLQPLVNPSPSPPHPQHHLHVRLPRAAPPRRRLCA